MGEETEMVAFCREQYPRLVGVLAFSVGSRDVAEELAQETLVRVCQHWPKVGAMAAPEAWMHKVGRNLATSWIRRRVAERRARERLQARAVAAVDGPDSGDEQALRSAIKALPDRQRTALVLRYYADLSAAEAATVMGCKPATVRVMTHQAIAALRRDDALALAVEVDDAP